MNNGTRAPRMTPEQRKVVFDFCLERQKSGDRDPQQAFQIAREIHGIRMKYSSFETGPWRDARNELKRRPRTEAIDIPPPVVKPRTENAETVIRSGLGSTKTARAARPAARAFYEACFAYTTRGEGDIHAAAAAYKAAWRRA